MTRGPNPPAVDIDNVTFKTTDHKLVFLGGETILPGSITPGTVDLANKAAALGLNVHTYNEDAVASGLTILPLQGYGKTFDEIATAITKQGITKLGLVGFSHGGGSVHDLSERLATNAVTAGKFTRA